MRVSSGGISVRVYLLHSARSLGTVNSPWCLDVLIHGLSPGTSGYGRKRRLHLKVGSVSERRCWLICLLILVDHLV